LPTRSDETQVKPVAKAVREGSTLAGNLINTRMRNAPISPDLTIKFEEVDLETLPDEEGQTISPQLVLADVEEAKPPEKEDKKARFNQILIEAVHVIVENWRVDDIIPSRNKFHEMTELKLKEQTGNDKGFSRGTFTAVLDNLVNRGNLRRIGTGTGTRYQVVLIPQGIKAKGPQKAA
jgi:hypothetical protein